MRSWMLPWLFPLGVLVTVALLSVSGVFAFALTVAWGWVLFPFGVRYIRSLTRTPGDADDDHSYWRINPS